LTKFAFDLADSEIERFDLLWSHFSNNISKTTFFDLSWLSHFWLVKSKVIRNLPRQSKSKIGTQHL